MTDYMTSAASNTANTEMLTSVPSAPLSLISVSLQTVSDKDTFDDSGFTYVYGASHSSVYNGILNLVSFYPNIFYELPFVMSEEEYSQSD